MTLHELDLLVVAHRRKEERADRRASMTGWILANVNRDEKRKPEPFSLEEIVSWLGHGYQRKATTQPASPEAPPDTEELKRRLDIVRQLHEAAQGRNGQTDG